MLNICKIWVQWIRVFFQTRQHLSQQLLKQSAEYAQLLRGNPALDQALVSKGLDEHAAVLQTLERTFPQYRSRIALVVTLETSVETCAVFPWKDRLFFFISPVLLCRRIDHPQEDLSHFEWMVQHEASHVRHGHTEVIFWLRKLTSCLGALAWISLPLHAASVLPSALLWSLLGASTVALVARTVYSLYAECVADQEANAAIDNPEFLQSALSWMKRVPEQVLQRFHLLPRAVRGLLYLLLCLKDPHPPWRWRIRKLQQRLAILHSATER